MKQFQKILLFISLFVLPTAGVTSLYPIERRTLALGAGAALAGLSALGAYWADQSAEEFDQEAGNYISEYTAQKESRGDGSGPAIGIRPDNQFQQQLAREYAEESIQNAKRARLVRAVSGLTSFTSLIAVLMALAQKKPGSPSLTAKDLENQIDKNKEKQREREVDFYQKRDELFKKRDKARESGDTKLSEALDKEARELIAQFQKQGEQEYKERAEREQRIIDLNRKSAAGKKRLRELFSQEGKYAHDGVATQAGAHLWEDTNTESGGEPAPDAEREKRMKAWQARHEAEVAQKKRENEEKAKRTLPYEKERDQLAKEITQPKEIEALQEKIADAVNVFNQKRKDIEKKRDQLESVTDPGEKMTKMVTYQDEERELREELEKNQDEAKAEIDRLMEKANGARLELHGLLTKLLLNINFGDASLLNNKYFLYKLKQARMAYQYSK